MGMKKCSGWVGSEELESFTVPEEIRDEAGGHRVAAREDARWNAQGPAIGALTPPPGLAGPTDSSGRPAHPGFNRSSQQ